MMWTMVCVTVVGLVTMSSGVAEAQTNNIANASAVAMMLPAATLRLTSMVSELSLSLSLSLARTPSPYLPNSSKYKPNVYN